ncbi:MAG: Uma2 family endonuclease [Hymenobacter sp.]|nr:MAG: Uma2 family endonuclease [Hymenobacter sp.]
MLPLKKPLGPREALETTRSGYELERGKPRPSFNHGFVQASLITKLNNRLRKTHTVTSETNLKLADQKTVPDLTVFEKRQPNMQRDMLWVQGIPLTTSEILSPNQDLDTLLEKAELYLAAGVKSCWVVLPAVGTVAVFTGPTTYRSFASGSAVLDEVLGVEIPLAGSRS